MKAPQIIMIALLAFNLLVGANRHGKPREGSENFYISLVGAGIQFGLLWWGGFF